MLFRLWALREGGCFQVFKHDDLILVDQFAGDFVLKVFAPVSDLAVTPCYVLYCFLASVTPALLPCKPLLYFRKLLLCFPKIAGMVNKLPIGERGEVGDSQVNAHIFIARRQGFWLAHLA